ncbi:MAG: PHP domain-containing protein, partial [Bacilli bacterium]
MNYPRLNIKTHYSLLSSLLNVDDVVSYAKINNIKYVSITDENMFGIMDAYYKLKEEGIELLPATSIKYKDISLNLYSTTYKGYTNLCNIVSVININGLITDEELIKYNSNIICVLDTNNISYFNELKDS